MKNINDPKTYQQTAAREETAAVFVTHKFIGQKKSAAMEIVFFGLLHDGVGG